MTSLRHRRWLRLVVVVLVAVWVLVVGCGSAEDASAPSSSSEPESEASAVSSTTTSTAEDVTTTASTTTAPPDPPVVMFPAYDEVPPFAGVVSYFEHEDEPGSKLVVKIQHAAPRTYEIVVLSESDEAPLIRPGEIFFGDGAENWIDHPSDPSPLSQGDMQHFWHLFFAASLPEATGVPGWSEVCGDSPIARGSEAIAGRRTTHLTCSTDLEDHELWIDETTGVVMRMAGPLQFPVLARDGYFTFTEITYGPIELEPRWTPTPDARSYPPFHLVREFTLGSTTSTIELWYRDAETIRREITDSDRSELVGTYNVVAEGNAGGCSPAEGFCEWEPLAEFTDEFFSELIGQMPMETRTARCTELEEVVVVGRPARHFACGDGSVTHDFWYDRATELLVREVGPVTALETLELEVDPVFPEGVFEYEETIPPTPDDPLAVGDAAPLWAGPLVSGGWFDLAESRGSPVVVFNWFPSCGDGCFDGLDLLQRLHDEFGEHVAFVSVSEAIESETARALDRRANTVPAVYCVGGTGGPDDVEPACTTPDATIDPWMASPWFLWGNPIPSVTVLDAEGTVVAIHTGFIDYVDELDQILIKLSEAAPGNR